METRAFTFPAKARLGRLCRHFAVFLTSAAALIFNTTHSLPAATITVTNTADSGLGTLRDALASAAHGDKIDFSLPTPATITLTSGELLVSTSVVIHGPGSDNLALAGNAADRVFHISSNTVLTISGLTITNGGGIFNDHATLTISNSTLSGNSAGALGGGAIMNAGGSLVIAHSTLNGNRASGGGGGGIRNRGSNGRSASLQIFSSTLRGNSAWFGGGIHSSADGADASVEIVSSTLTGNSATHAGGIISFAEGGSATLSVLNSTLSGNSAYNGGGIWNGNGGSLRIISSTLSGNSAGGVGGAIANYGGHANIHNSTLSGNSAEDGSGSIHNSGTVQLGSTILNEFSSAGTFSSSGIISFGYNISSDSGAGFLTNTTDQINSHPRLGPLQNNGGPTLTHAPLPSSLAIDKGRNLSASLTDQRGFARTIDYVIGNATGGDGTDIGAVEMSALIFLSDFRTGSNESGFNVIGASNQSFIVEASIDFANWTPLATNTLGAAPFYFNDPIPQNLPRRFYRTHLP